MEIQGKLIAAMPTRSGVSQRSGNPWQSRDFVLEIPGQYVRHFVFTVFGEDRLKQFNLRKGEEVIVSFDIDAHEYQGKWYNSCRAYNVERVSQQAAPAPAQAQQAAPAQNPFPPAQQDNGGGGSADDLPFD